MDEQIPVIPQKAPRSQTDIVKRWQDRISIAKKYRDRMATEYGWERYIREYKGVYDLTMALPNGDRIPVPPINQVFSYVQSDLAGMSFKNPYMAVNPRKKGSIQGAAILEAALNYYWRELRIKAENESTMLDADLPGHGWNKDGYYAETEGPEDQPKVKKEGIYSMRVSWRDIVFNIGARRPPKDCLWMAHRIILPRDVAIDRWPFLSKLEGVAHPHLKEAEAKEALFKDDIKVIVLWEIHDAMEREVGLIAEGYDQWVKKPTKWPDYVEEFPFLMLWYYEMPDESYPMSPISAWESQILETNKLFAQALNHVKRWNRQGFYRKGSIEDQDADKYVQGIDGALIPVNIPANQSINDFLKFADYGNLPPDIYLLLDRLAQYERETNGQPEFERGGITKTNTRTLGELQQIASGSKNRQDKRVDRLENFMEDIARHLIAHMQANFNVEQTAKIVDETPEQIVQAFGDKFNPVTKSVVFTKDDIQGEYDVDVKAGSTLPLNKESRLAIFREVLGIAVKLTGPLPAWVKVIILDMLRDYQLVDLQAAFEVQQAEAQKEAAAQAQDQQMGAAKTAAETHKRASQADQIDLENAITEQQLTMAPDIAAQVQGSPEDVVSVR